MRYPLRGAAGARPRVHSGISAARALRASLSIAALLGALATTACDRRTDAGLALDTSPPLPNVPQVDLRALPDPPPPPPYPDGSFAWWNDAVFYEVFVRSFRDSDGDGVGDIRGLIERLDYLNDGDPATDSDLGVTGIWLMPIAESPSYHGYDTVDYRRVDRDYGTDGDFLLLMEEAHRRGIRVITDLVLNHSSSQHPWFLASRADPAGPWRDFYVWEPFDPGFERPWGGSPWHATESGYYYGLFWGGMPDLNYRYEPVTQAMFDVIRYWLEDMRTDGFRLDAIKHLIEDGARQEHTAATHAWLRGFRRFVKSVKPDAVTVGEVWSGTDAVVSYVGDQLDMAFEFEHAGAILQSASSERRTAVLESHRRITAAYPPHQFATFLSNHDQRRVMSVLGGNVARAKTAASLLLTGPGVPFMYYGEEIGHQGGKPDENLRTPMQWTGGPNAGFTDGPRPWRPPQADHVRVNVETQAGDPRSLLSHYRRLIRARNAHPALRTGSWREIAPGDDRLYAFLREHPEESLLVLVNLSGAPVADYALRLDRGPFRGSAAEEVLTGAYVSAPWLNGAGGFDAYRPVGEVPPYATWLIRIR